VFLTGRLSSGGYTDTAAVIVEGVSIGRAFKLLL
jgi:hypothetical protein